jgi:hypothetical protein
LWTSSYKAIKWTLLKKWPLPDGLARMTTKMRRWRTSKANDEVLRAVEVEVPPAGRVLALREGMFRKRVMRLERVVRMAAERRFDLCLLIP